MNYDTSILPEDILAIIVKDFLTRLTEIHERLNSGSNDLLEIIFDILRLQGMSLSYEYIAEHFGLLEEFREYVFYDFDRLRKMVDKICEYDK